MENEPRHLCMSEKRFNFALGTTPEPWVREPSEQKLENTVTNSLHKIKRVLYLIDTAEDISLGTSPSISTINTDYQCFARLTPNFTLRNVRLGVVIYLLV